MKTAFLDCSVQELLVWQHTAKYYRIQKSVSRSSRLGLSKSHHKGRGIEFHNARIYQAGDDARAIDWRITARKNKAHTREFQEDRDQQTLLLVDMGLSMRFGSHNKLKSVQAAQLAALCGWTVLLNQDRIGGVVLGGHPSVARPSRRRSHFSAWLAQLSHASKCLLTDDAGRASSWEVGIQSALNLVNNSSTFIFIGDLLQLKASHKDQLRRLAKKHDVIALHVYDELEWALPQAGDARFSYKGDVLTVDLSKVHQTYRQQYTDEIDSLRSFFLSYGMNFQVIETQEAPLLRLQQLGIVVK